MATILFVENDVKFSNEIKSLFADNNYVVFVVKTNQEAYLCCKRNVPDIVFLSDQKESCPGLVYLKLIRQQLPDRLILVLGEDFTSQNLVSKLDHLADSYIPRSVGAEGVFAYTEALERLVERGRNEKMDLLIMPDVYLDVASRDLVVNTERFRLALQEFLLLEVLTRNLGYCVPKPELYRVLWNREAIDCAGRLRKLVYKCSRKLKAVPVVRIKTLHSYGYMLCLNN